LPSIESEAIIHNRFRAGLHPLIQQHCITTGSKDINQWLRTANGWWTAYHPTKLSMANNPFEPRDCSQRSSQIYNSVYFYEY
ncbi:uncharacterized protein BX664DRAFT_238981, partial [Halteromyces radiatus]|uniref:uncharacterized protein n=1 Tax=Halteromyces radiatus TaxID=101107 RepID=UPI00221F8871